MSLFKLKKFLLIAYISFFSFLSSVSYAENFDTIRNKAISVIKEGQTNKGLRVLESLASKGDLKSIIIAGSLFLNGKNIPKDYKRAHFWFKKGSEQCDQKSILILEKYFYKRRGSEFFDPQKIDYLKSSCLKKKNNNSETALKEPPKNRNIKKQLPSNLDNNNKPTSISDNDDLIDVRVSRSWQNIAPQKGKIIGGGSGFAINKDGYFLTNEHVIDNCDGINIKYNNLYGIAKIINFEKRFDAAILKVNAPTPYFAKFDTEDYVAGEKLYAAGFPVESMFGRNMSFSEGMLTNAGTSKNKIRFFDGAMLISVPIASGNSGGPVMNKYGSIRGMVSAGFGEDVIKKYFNKDSKLVIGNVTFNIMVSGNLLKKWLDDNRISSLNRSISQPKLDSDIIGKMAKKFVADIECVKNE